MKTFPAIIEISQDSPPVKYEFNKEFGMLEVDRFMPTAMQYPCNYGFFPNTLGGDGDPIDCFVYTRYPIHPGAMIEVRPIGVLETEDEKGRDEKILALPTTKAEPFFTNIQNYTDLPEILLEKIVHFCENYKGLEKEKWVKVKGWKNEKTAIEMIEAGFQANVI